MPPAPSLQRDDIVDAAIRLIERDGVEGLSMRRLASELGSKPMTLYNYVDNKSELLQLVLTEVAARIPWTRPEGPPRERMITVAVDMYNELAAISWIVPILREGTTVGAPALVLADTFVSAAVELGIDEVTAMSTWRSVWYIVASELQWQDTLARRRPGEKSWHQTIDPDLLTDVPTIARLLPHLIAYSREFRVRDAVAAQIDGVLSHLND
ncbi:TetR/AcrR family transcriptional regulator [Gordonia polyisoprenivorans]|uniref:TetR/AcrR family transcriptional regulator n=1 Tax=Gordonia polyisoprenivorans TaxID=84595 RepID=UPI002301E69C|nr:TetR family transcriptional regulator [Gordonia polyisoprenivorans]WCB38541.1 TetR family transcriptional regulator [Gordonia polyisoprenivorans]